MNRLKEYLDFCSQEYYTTGTSPISDAVFDTLAESCAYSQLGSSARNTGSHFYPMFSLQKYYEDETKQRPLEGFKDIDMSPKLDGAAISILYLNGMLARVLTRGDGKEGQIVTDKFINSKLIPQTIPNLEPIQITGEIVAPVNIENARNYAAGSLSLKDVSEFRTRAITFFAYGVYPYQSVNFIADMAILSKWGFSTVKDPEIVKIYPCDGVVFRLNSNKEFESLGYTSKFPRGAYAKKERGNFVETTLLNVEWQVGKTGKVTPVAILEPINLGGAIVTRASLHNYGFIRELGICIGDRVAVIRAGEIIPQVTHKVE